MTWSLYYWLYRKAELEASFGPWFRAFGRYALFLSRLKHLGRGNWRKAFVL